MSRDTWRVSPQQIDPLSWLTRPLVPAVFAAMAFGYGAITLVTTWDLLDQPWLDIIALILATMACVIVQLWTRPLRVPFSTRHAVLPIALGVIAVVLSSVNARESGTLVQHWWVPIGVGFVIGSLAPYSSVRSIILYGSLLTVVTGAGAWYGFLTPVRVWPEVSVIVIGASGMILATVSTATFTHVVVSTTQQLQQGAGTPLPESEQASEEAARRVERRTLARLGTRVAPFLQGIADSGTVTESDRAVAGQLARKLRSDLVSQANRSWLDEFALYGPILVVDPDRRADHMNTVQRTALRGLLTAVLKNPTHGGGSLFVELRGQTDGSTAVALSLDIHLPEGRRTMMLAPYYLTLQTAVQALSWDPSRELIKFQFPARND